MIEKIIDLLKYVADRLGAKAFVAAAAVLGEVYIVKLTLPDINTGTNWTGIVGVGAIFLTAVTLFYARLQEGKQKNEEE